MDRNERIGTHPGFYWLNENRNYSDDHDYEDRKERRILKHRVVERQRMYITDPGSNKARVRTG
ncbi:MAG: hypothetical protein JO327_06625 [Nitrososphaeraceae archaeon]|nr:hypothetical protein [Nitrososphaeraceae archaeon]MBV9667789.1 hypothetical protein [Nitrososphaeraceae archaeon]